jgi:hypothetical protein
VATADSVKASTADTASTTDATSNPSAADASAATPAPATDNTVAGTAATPATFVSNGSPMTLAAIGVVMTPPKGWEVSTQNGSLSVVMREPVVGKALPGTTKYQRNITIATIHRASPIDEKRATELQAELIRNFSADSTVSQFKVLDHKFFNYHGSNDGLLVYSSLNIGEYPMMQMHVLVSGQDKQYLMTYTDLASQFGSEKDPAFTVAWDSIVSIQVNGVAPSRMDQYMPYGIAGGIFTTLLLVGYLWRRRATRYDYKGVADALLDNEGNEPVSDHAFGDASSMMATLDGKWCLSGDGDEAGSFSHAASSIDASSDFGFSQTSRYAKTVVKRPIKADKAGEAVAAAKAGQSTDVGNPSGLSGFSNFSNLSGLSGFSDFSAPVTGAQKKRTTKPASFVSNF